MVLPFLSGSRRGRMLGIAILLTIFTLWLTSQTPLSTVRQNPFDLHPATPPKQPSGETSSHGHTGSHHDYPAQEAEADAEDVITDVEDHTEVEPVVVTTTTTTTTRAAEATEASESTPTPSPECPDFEPDPVSEGRRKLPYTRPAPECRKFSLPALEDLIEHMKKVIRDPDLFRLFENSYPKALDTAVKWRGYAAKKDETTGEETETDEELTYVITGGDVNAMWLRDSATQLYSYFPLLEASKEKDSLASLWRGLINAHSRYITIAPYCHSFQPPPESGIKPSPNNAPTNNHTGASSFNTKAVFDCKWELDGLASFLQLSTAYYTRTGDLDFFGKYSWIDAVEAAVDASAAMRRVHPNDLGSPVKENGMVRSAFRPSDEPSTFQLLTPSNMMWAAYLEQASEIMRGLAEGGDNKKAANLTAEMRTLSRGILQGIALDAVVQHREFGPIFAYEVDGYGGTNLMDEPNLPSLLAMPLWNYTLPAAKQMVKSTKHTPRTTPETTGAITKSTRPHTNLTTPAAANLTTSTITNLTAHSHNYTLIYQNTRSFALSASNPRSSPTNPFAAVLAALTAYSDLAGYATPAQRDEAVAGYLQIVLDAAGSGVVSNQTAAAKAWSEEEGVRRWEGWVDGVVGLLVLRIAEEVDGDGEGLLGRLWQDS